MSTKLFGVIWYCLESTSNRLLQFQTRFGDENGKIRAIKSYITRLVIHQYDSILVHMSKPQQLRLNLAKLVTRTSLELK